MLRGRNNYSIKTIQECKFCIVCFGGCFQTIYEYWLYFSSTCITLTVRSPSFLWGNILLFLIQIHSNMWDNNTNVSNTSFFVQ